MIGAGFEFGIGLMLAVLSVVATVGAVACILLILWRSRAGLFTLARAVRSFVAFVLTVVCTVAIPVFMILQFPAWGQLLAWPPYAVVIGLLLRAWVKKQRATGRPFWEWPLW